MKLTRKHLVDTWAGEWGTKPESPEEAENQKAFAANPAVLMEKPNSGFRD